MAHQKRYPETCAASTDPELFVPTQFRIIDLVMYGTWCFSKYNDSIRSWYIYEGSDTIDVLGKFRR